MGRSVNEIAYELSLGLNQQQLTLLVELLAAKNESSEGAQPRSKRQPITLLPAEWIPNTEHYVWATEHGKSKSWVDSIAEDMRNWAASKGERRACWNGTFKTFMKRALEPRPVQQKLFSGTFTPKLIGGGYA